MHPTLCSLGHVHIHSYGMMLAIAVIVCTYCLSRELRPKGFSAADICDLVFWVVFIGLIGARFFYVILNIKYFLGHPVEIAFLHRGGLAVQGGVASGALAFAVFIRRKQWSFWKMADYIVPYLALGHAIGRIGCFLNGCCHGYPSRFGIFFPAHGARLIPTQLYAAGALLAIFFILKKVRGMATPLGFVVGLYLILWGAQRFIIEFFRADHTVLFFGLSVFQCVSVIIMVVGGIIMFMRTRKTHGHV